MHKQPPLAKQTFGDRIAVDGPGGSLTYRYGDLPKPCVHPLVTPGGQTLSGYEMSDHVWHRGLWFTIKFINGTNFWEEIAPFGVQKSVGEPTIRFESADATRIEHQLAWTSDATGIVLEESRTLRTSATPAGFGVIDWSTKLTAKQNLTLDRTPFTTWGGYGGLSFRATRELHKGHLMSSDGKTTDFIPGLPGDWVVMQGLLDGGVGRKGAIGMIDHPSNPRSPTPWYCKFSHDSHLLNAAFLFDEPMTLTAGQTLAFQYRVVYRDGYFTAEEFEAIAKTYRATPAVG